MCALVIRADGFEVPQRGIYSVVFRCFAQIRKAVGQHTLIHTLREFKQDIACSIESARNECQSRKRDHRVASPIAEPVVASDNGLVLATRNDELIGGSRERLY